MLLDIGYLAMTTPVAAFSCYVCVLALKTLLRNGFYEIPWMIVAMLPTCLLTLIAYWRWIITLGRYAVKLKSLVRHVCARMKMLSLMENELIKILCAKGAIIRLLKFGELRMKVHVS